jgi:hypothetical protein
MEADMPYVPPYSPNYQNRFIKKIMQEMDMKLSNAIVIRNKDVNFRAAAARKGRARIIKCLFVLTIMH